MELNLMIEGQEGVSWEQWRALAAACEEHHVPALFRSDHYLPLGGHEERPVLDAWSTVCGLAATTTTLRLGTLVSPATFRHPSVFAKAAVTADHISGGRIEVGLGAGWNAREHAAYGFPFADNHTRFDVFAEQLQIVQGLWGDGPFSFAGEHYTLDAVDARPKPLQRPHLPLIVGGKGGPRTIALAARHADEFNTVFATPAQVAQRRALAVAGWEAAGRDPATLRYSVMAGYLCGRDSDQLHHRLDRLAVEHGQEPDAAAWVTGTPEQALARLGELRDAGVDRVMLQMLLHDDLDQVALIEELARQL
jgi:F420-dependent oxidoreductase-like protein